MIVKWANEAKTYLRVEIGGNQFTIPTDESSPDWVRIKAMADAGALVISPYEPPQPPQETFSE